MIKYHISDFTQCHINTYTHIHTSHIDVCIIYMYVCVCVCDMCLWVCVPKQHSQMGPSQAHPGPIWGPTLPNWGPTGAHMEFCLGACVFVRFGLTSSSYFPLCYHIRNEKIHA